MVVSVDPLRIYVHRNGLSRFCTEKYCEPEEKNIKNTFMHLTNYSINKFSSKFKENSEEESKYK